MDINKFNNEITKLLRGKALTSTEIRDYLLEMYPDENWNTIKSMISRSKLLYKSKKTYKNGAVAYTLKSNRNRDILFERLSSKDDSMMSFVVELFKRNDTFMSEFTFGKLFGINKADDIIKKLELLKAYYPSLKLNGNVISRFEMQTDYPFYEEQAKRLLAAKILLNKHNSENVIQIGRTNYLSLKGKSIITPNALYGIRFDAYTNSFSFIHDSNEHPFIVYDFSLRQKYSVQEIKSFINRCNSLRKRSKKIVVPFVICEDIEIEAKKMVKKNGILLIAFSSFLGGEYKELLEEINKIENGRITPISFEGLINKTKTIGIFNHTKGQLFEYLCYELLLSLYGGDKNNIKRDVNVKTAKGYPLAQFDIVIYDDNETVFVECKATTSQITLGNESKPYRNTIYYTIGKMNSYSKAKNKKLLYITTSSYKIKNEEKTSIKNEYCSRILNKIDDVFLSKDLLIESDIKGFWLEIMKKHF